MDQITELKNEIAAYAAEGDTASVADLTADLKSLEAAAAVEAGVVGADEAVGGAAGNQGELA